MTEEQKLVTISECLWLILVYEPLVPLSWRGALARGKGVSSRGRHII